MRTREIVAACGLALHVTGQPVARSGLGASLTPSDVVEGMAAALKELSGAAAHPGPDAHPHPLNTDLPFPFITFDQAAPR